MSTRRGSPSAVAQSVPFSATGFTAKNVKDGIIEAKQNAEGFPRAGISLVMNGTVSNNSWVTYSELTPNVPIVFPVKTQLKEISFANNTNNVQFDLEFYKNGIAGGNLIYTWSVNTGAGINYKYADLSSQNLIFNAGDWIRLLYKDTGTNASDGVWVLWIARIP
jgi:hypothetical protein